MSKKRTLTIVLTLLVAVCLFATTALAAVVPSTPSMPSAPSGTTAPSTPSNPSQPSQPSQPVVPSQPSQPVVPSQPSKPVEPSQPSKPVEPSQPSKPVEPSQPSKPVEPSQPSQPVEPEMKFVDVAEGAWYYDAVMWAVKNGVTAGMTPTTFVPDGSCTRAQMVEFLWNAVGKPTATIKSVPFTDVPESGSADYWYEDSLLWVYEAGIVAGTTSTTFSPAKECTRAEMVCFLVRLLSDGATDNMPFVDVTASAWYYNEVQWAWANGLTVGTSATTFSPDKVCTRAEAVEFLYNAFAK